MSTNSKDQEVDLGQIFKSIKGFFESILDRFFEFILFLKNNSIVIIILLILGFTLGYFLDQKNKTYEHEIIVTPNFGSADYLYAKIDLLNSKKKENDTLFFSSIGVNEPKKMGIIEIEPIVDVYKFVDNKKENFELIKLMAEEGNLKEIIENDITSKNYPFHKITFNTVETTTNKNTIDPILKFLNDSDYFTAIQKQNLINIKAKMVANDSTIAQINALLNEFSSNSINQKSDKLIYYNENNYLNDIIKTKENLIIEQGNNKINMINLDKVIKDISVNINKKSLKGIRGKLKFIIPFLFLIIFFSFITLKVFYKKQIAKRS
ncbi:hypothetical protein GOQ30_15625 [Flavobacterium sp. TP390]|uniref:Uncharacterized protein n=1 Tax=Flavobacterium profundi TaxID=1774945 RepID=A0A6I4IUP4_9FLAO|nr:hypothetical protein [Flavobacterium profundi]MVO10603.1 hypothetical protein [Flavobacterium profundi]